MWRWVSGYLETNITAWILESSRSPTRELNFSSLFQVTDPQIAWNEPLQEMDLSRWNRIPFDAYCLSSEEEKKRFETDYAFQIDGVDLTIKQKKVKSQISVGFAIWDSVCMCLYTVDIQL